MTQEPIIEKITEKEIRTLFELLKSYQRKTELLEMVITTSRKITFGERLFWVLAGMVAMFLCRGYYV